MKERGVPKKCIMFSRWKVSYPLPINLCGLQSRHRKTFPNLKNSTEAIVKLHVNEDHIPDVKDLTVIANAENLDNSCRRSQDSK